MTLAEQSREICDIASEAAGSGPGWTKRFLFELSSRDWAIHALPKGTKLGEDGPIWAPIPPDEPDAYPYPSVIAPVGWNGPTA